MRIGGNGRLAWAVALAALALWATAAPPTIGSLPGREQSASGGQPWALDIAAQPDLRRDDGEAQSDLAATPSIASENVPPPAATAPAATFRLCGGPDPGAERAIERLIDGHSFKAWLVSRGDGCADLTITVSSESPPRLILGRQSTRLAIAAGTAPSDVLSLRIVTENGVTRASIGGLR